MSATAQYASTPKVGVASISTANTNRDGSGTLGTVYTAGPNGARIDKITTKASATTTAGMVRYFLTRGIPGVTITSITFVGTTATVTTQVAHGRTSGDLVTVQGALPDNYNVTNAAITVTSATQFTYVMGTAPTANATSVGYYAATTSAPTSQLLTEVLVSAAVPSGTVAAFSNSLSSTNLGDQGILPIILAPGWSLRAATHNAEAFNCIAAASGDF